VRMKNVETVNWTIPVPKRLDQAVEDAVRKGWHKTKSELVREAVRQHLEKLGFKP